MPTGLADITIAAPSETAVIARFVPLAIVAGLFALVAWICRPRPRPAPEPVIDLVGPLPFDDARYLVEVLERDGIRAATRRPAEPTARRPDDATVRDPAEPAMIVVRAVDGERALAVLRTQPPRPPQTPLDAELERALDDTSWFEPSERQVDAQVERYTAATRRGAVLLWSLGSAAMTAAAAWAAFG